MQIFTENMTITATECADAVHFYKLYKLLHLIAMFQYVKRACSQIYLSGFKINFIRLPTCHRCISFVNVSKGWQIILNLKH